MGGSAHRLFSARAESLSRRAAWAESFKFRRAVVPVDGIWMWHDVDGRERPFLIHDKGGAPLYLAALWQPFADGERSRGGRVGVGERGGQPFGRAVWRAHARDTSRRRRQRVAGTPTSCRRARWSGSCARRPRATCACAPPIPTPSAPHHWRPPPTSARRSPGFTGRSFRPEKPRFAGKRRHVLRESEAGGHVFFKTRSFTRDDATVWHPVVDVECGHVFCDCPDFRYRHAIHEPDVSTPQWWCKHLRRAVANCKRHGELGSVSPN